MAQSGSDAAPISTHPTAVSGSRSIPPLPSRIRGFLPLESFADLFDFGFVQEEEVTVERTPEEEEARLRYLEFVQQAAAQAVVLAAAAYAYAKQGAGPLRPGVEHVEGTVKAVVGPVYDRYHAVPLDLLKFIDRKVRADENALAPA
jgi:hypothetical protein